MNTPLTRILIVDREYLVAMEAERILLDQLPCTVEIVTPHDLLHVLGQWDFDVLVIDSGLVNDDWKELIREQRRRDTPVVLTTLGTELRSELKEFAYAPVARKPFNDDELREAIRAALASRSDRA